MLDKIGREGLGIFLIRPFMCKKAVERITIRAQGCSVGCQTLFTQILGTNVKYGIVKYGIVKYVIAKPEIRNQMYKVEDKTALV